VSGRWLSPELPPVCVQVFFLQQFTGKAGLPQLQGFGLLDHEVARGVSSYLVISPKGQLLGVDTEPVLVRTVFRQIASTIKELLDLGILHRWVQEFAYSSKQATLVLDILDLSDQSTLVPSLADNHEDLLLVWPPDILFFPL